MFGEPEQQPEAPLGIENAVSGAKGSFGDEHSGHGRLYKPQATIARPPASGQPQHSVIQHHYRMHQSAGTSVWSISICLEAVDLVGVLLYAQKQSLAFEVCCLCAQEDWPQG